MIVNAFHIVVEAQFLKWINEEVENAEILWILKSRLQKKT